MLKHKLIKDVAIPMLSMNISLIGSCFRGRRLMSRLQFFLCLRDDSQGALRFAPVCPSVCLSVRPFVTLYGIEFV